LKYYLLNKMLTEAIVVVVVVVLWQVVSFFRQRQWDHGTFKRMGVPFEEPHVIYGSYHIMRNDQTSQVDVLLEWEKKHGKVFGFFTGGEPFLTITDLDMTKQILIKDFDAFSNRMIKLSQSEPFVSNLIMTDGKKWKETRTLLSTTFSAAKMKLMMKSMHKKTDRMINNFASLEKRGESFDCYSKFQALTLEVICECALALESNCQDNVESDTLLKQLITFQKAAFGPVVALFYYFPLLRKVISSISRKFTVASRMSRMIVAHLKKVLAYRKRVGISSQTLDVIQLMLNTSLTVNTDVKGRNLPVLTDDDIIGNCFMFLFAGFETTANALAFTTLMLARNPDIQERLYEEINKIIPEDEENITYDQIFDIEYLEQVLNESLRMYPPVISFVLRRAVRTTNVGGYEIPKNTNILIPLWNIHRNSENWPEPDVFDPERFSPETLKTEQRHPMAFIPFGAGPRNCIGMRFAKMEAKLAIIKMVKKFRIVLPPGAPENPKIVTPSFGIKPSPGLPIRLMARE